jgi:hypothetical protein
MILRSASSPKAARYTEAEIQGEGLWVGASEAPTTFGHVRRGVRSIKIQGVPGTKSGWE